MIQFTLVLSKAVIAEFMRHKNVKVSVICQVSEIVLADMVTHVYQIQLYGLQMIDAISIAMKTCYIVYDCTVQIIRVIFRHQLEYYVH